MGRFIEELGASGYLEIWKEYADGELELVHSDHNTIVSGMGVGLALLFGGTGSDTINNSHKKHQHTDDHKQDHRLAGLLSSCECL